MEKLWIPKASESKEVKMMLIVFFDIQGIIHFEFLPQGQTVNQIIYKEILQCLVKSVHDKRQGLWKAHAWALHHNNAPAHTAPALNIRQFLAERNITTLEHFPYSPDLASCDFFLFPKIKSLLKEPIFLTSIPSKWLQQQSSKRSQKMPSKNVLNHGKGKCTNVFQWKGITLKEFDFGIFQYFSIKFL